MEFLFCISAIRDKNIMKILLNNSNTIYFIFLNEEQRKRKEINEREVMRSEILSIP